MEGRQVRSLVPDGCRPSLSGRGMFVHYSEALLFGSALIAAARRAWLRLCWVSLFFFFFRCCSTKRKKAAERSDGVLFCTWPVVEWQVSCNEFNGTPVNARPGLFWAAEGIAPNMFRAQLPLSCLCIMGSAYALWCLRQPSSGFWCLVSWCAKSDRWEHLVSNDCCYTQCSLHIMLSSGRLSVSKHSCKFGSLFVSNLSS